MTGDPPQPRVAIAVPTYNRADGLKVAIDSVLAQDFQAWELIICDNASTDKTATVAKTYADREPRIRVHRQPGNLGPTANFVEGLKLTEAPLFMWLADDDWIEPNYLSACVKRHDDQPDHALVAGRVRYQHKEREPFDGASIDLQQDDSAERMLGYYRGVTDNGIFYGVMKTEFARRSAFPNTLGGDWIFLAGLIYQGKVSTLRETVIHRDYNWNAQSIKRISESAGFSPFVEKHPYLSIALEGAAAVRSRDLFADLDKKQRRRLSHRVFLALVRKKKLGFFKIIRGLLAARKDWRPAIGAKAI